jgi:hypothetical protein
MQGATMGLELVEYVIAIEDAFEIDISDADAMLLDTPAKLIDYLCAHLGDSPDGPPLVQTAFYWLRSAFADELAVSRTLIHPATTVSALTNRPENDVWRAVASRLEVNPKFLTHAPVAKWIAKLVRAPGRTVGDLARQVAMLHPAAFKREGEGWTRAQMKEVALRLLEHEIGIAVGSAHLHASFIRDLGMG